MLKHGVIDECVLKDKGILKSEDVLRRLSSALSKRWSILQVIRDK